MSSSTVVSLGALRLQAQVRSDLLGSPNISNAMWHQFISLSSKDLYDLLIGAYGNDYSVATPFTLTMTANTLYDLPPDFYKLLGVDLQYSSSPTGWTTLKRFEFLERNKFGYLMPAINTLAQTARIWYVPAPTSLIFFPTCSTTFNTAVVGVSDVTGLSVGMTAYGSGIPANSTILSIDSTLSQVTLSLACTLTQPIVCLQFWTDAATIKGISGWEEYVILDAAIKAMMVQESDCDRLILQRDKIQKRIEGMAEGRDAGQASHVTDALSMNSCGYNMLGAASLRYHLLGDQLMLVPCADDQGMDDYGGGWY